MSKKGHLVHFRWNGELYFYQHCTGLSEDTPKGKLQCDIEYTVVFGPTEKTFVFRTFTGLLRAKEIIHRIEEDIDRLAKMAVEDLLDEQSWKKDSGEPPSA